MESNARRREPWLSLSEETLTETALYNIAIAHQGKDIQILLATKPAEKKHGADWEWWLVRGKKGLGFRVQAKRLFADGRYHALFKTGAKYQQLDTLVSVSASTGLEPLYCFFNFDHPQYKISGPNTCKHSYRGPSFWGCSLAFPDQVKKTQSDSLQILRPYMHPWHTLVCESAKPDLLDAASNFVRREGRRAHRPGPRDLPSRVLRLLEISDRRRMTERRAYLDDDYWSEESDTPEDVSGLVVVRDLRE